MGTKGHSRKSTELSLSMESLFRQSSLMIWLRGKSGFILECCSDKVLFVSVKIGLWFSKGGFLIAEETSVPHCNYFFWTLIRLRKILESKYAINFENAIQLVVVVVCHLAEGKTLCNNIIGKCLWEQRERNHWLIKIFQFTILFSVSTGKQGLYNTFFILCERVQN